MNTQIFRKIATTTTVILASLLLINCGENNQQWSQKAPQTEEELGFLVEGTTKEKVDELLLNNPQASARVLGPSIGLYEIYNLSEKQIAQELGHDVDIIKNELFEVQSQKQTFTQQMQTLKNKVHAMNSPAPGSRQSICASQNIYPPVAAMKLTEKPNKKFYQTNTIDINETLKLEQNSIPSRYVGGEVDNYWFMIPPPSSKLKPVTAFKGDKITFTPDALGPYSIGIVARDQRGVCSQLKLISVGVTSNPKLKKDITPFTLQDSFDNNKNFRENFFHLLHISAFKSWEISKGKGVKIAIIDSGVNYNHSGINQNILPNENEIPGDGLDNDGNGFIDDMIGRDFVNGDNFPFDDGGHGSHVAGLAGSSVFGVAKEAQIIPIKALSTFGQGDVGTSVGATYYAISRGAKVINMSLGGYAPYGETRVHRLMRKALKYANDKGVLVIAAAGNGDPRTGSPVNTDILPNYPSSFRVENLISVASTFNDKLAVYSNYGPKTVDMAAPGGGSNGLKSQLLSLSMANLHEKSLQRYSGTSMATPLVSGAAAQLFSAFPELTPKEVKVILMHSGVELPVLAKTTVSGKHLNSNRALISAKTYVEEKAKEE